MAEITPKGSSNPVLPDANKEVIDEVDAAAKQQKTDEVQEGDEALAKETAKAEEGDETDGTRRTKQNSQKQTGERPQQKQTLYKKDTGQTRGAEIPKQFGHKINTQRSAEPQTTPDTFESDEAPEQSQTAQDKTLVRQQARPMPKQPPAQTYRNLMQERVFRAGILRETPVSQKLQKQGTRQQQQAKQADPRQDDSDVMTRREVGQMAALRHTVTDQNRKTLRDILRYEIARIREQRAKQKVKSVKSQSEGHKKSQGALTKKATPLDKSQLQLAQKLTNAKTLSLFEKILQKVLKGEAAVPSLAKGVRANFALKSDAQWKAFFKAVAHQGSQSQLSQAKMGQLIEAMYRGHFTHPESGQTHVVIDFAFSLEGETAENKFSQLALKDGKLLAALKQLRPGEVIGQNILDQMGTEFEFLKLVHLLQVLQMTEEEKQAVLKRFRQSHSSESQDRMERDLLERRQKGEQEAKKQPFVWAGDQFDKKERYTDRPRFFMLMLYAIGLSTAGLIGYVLIRTLM